MPVLSLSMMKDWIFVLYFMCPLRSYLSFILLIWCIRLIYHMLNPLFIPWKSFVNVNIHFYVTGFYLPILYASFASIFIRNIDLTITHF